MAFEIATPQVGKTLLTTFAALSAENRKAQELELREAKLVQDELLKTAMQGVRERALDLRGTTIANQASQAEARLALATIASERAAALAEVKMQKDALAIDREKGDIQGAQEAAAILASPDSQGRTLQQRLLSDDPKEVDEAMKAFVGATGRLQGRGRLTDGLFDDVRRSFGDRQRQIEGRLRAEFNARREARMAEGQQADDTRADAALEQRKKEAAARAAGGGRLSSANKAATVTRTTVSPEKDAKLVMKGTPDQIAAQKRIEDLQKRGDTGEKNALGETHAEELARLESVLLGAPPSLEEGSAELGLPPVTAKPSAIRPIQGKIYPHKSGQKMRWIGGEDGDITDSANWEVVP